LADAFLFPLINHNLKIDNDCLRDPREGNDTYHLSSVFDNNRDKNDHVSIDDLGKIDIFIGTLEGGKSVLINYSTFILKNASKNSLDICSRMYQNDFNWDIIATWIEPKVGNITMKVITTQKKMAILVDPQYNITCWEEGKCKVFKNTKISFSNDLIIKDKANTSFKDDIIDDSDESKLVNNSYFVNTIGTHKFSGEIRHPFDIIQIGNDTYIQVIDIGDYHKGLIYSFKFILYMLLSLLVPLLIIGAMRYFKKCKDKNYIGLLLLGIILAYVFYVIYYIFLCRYYQDTVKLESITLSVAYLVLLYYYLCIDKELIDKEPKELLKQKFGVKKIDNGETIKVSTEKLNDKETDVSLEVDGEIYIGKMENDELYQKHNPIIPIVQIILMGLFTIFFHYYLPEILSNSLAYLFLSALGLAIGTFILAMKKPICKFIECAGPEKDSLIRIGFSILAFVYIILISIYDIKDTGVAFSPKFGLLEIIIIICTELMPLITVAIVGMSAETAWNFMTLVLGDAKKS
jgi:hypothetical protein